MNLKSRLMGRKEEETPILEATQKESKAQEPTIQDYYIIKFGDTADAEICILLHAIYYEIKKQNESLEK